MLNRKEPSIHFESITKVRPLPLHTRIRLPSQWAMLNDEWWWMMNDEWWMKNDEWWMMNDEWLSIPWITNDIKSQLLLYALNWTSHSEQLSISPEYSLMMDPRGQRIFRQSGKENTMLQMISHDSLSSTKATRSSEQIFYKALYKRREISTTTENSLDLES